MTKPAKLQVTEPWVPLVPGQLARESVEVVERIHRLFLQAAEDGLADLLQSPVKMVPGETALATFSKTLANDGPRDRAIALDLSPVSGCGFLSFSSPLLFGVLDILLATPEDTPDDPERTVTGIELHVLQEFFGVFARTLADTWRGYYPAAFRHISLSNDELESRVAAVGNDPALTLSATLEVGGKSAAFRLVVPTCLARLADLKLKSTDAGRAEPESVHGNILDRLGDAKLDVEAVLQGARIRIRDLLELAPGRILAVANCRSSSFECLVNGTPQFTGDLVPRNGRYGIQLAEMALPPEAGS